MTLLQKLQAILNRRKLSNEQKLQEMLALAKEVPPPPKNSGFGVIFIPIIDINDLLLQIPQARMSAKLCALWAREVQEAWSRAFPDSPPESPIVVD